LFTDHPGLESLALVMLIGLPLCLLASLTTLPAAAMLLLARRGDDSVESSAADSGAP
jgi:predicted RND superfamily exporter protein